MPKGNLISEEIQRMIWNYFNLGKTSEDAMKFSFDQNRACTLKPLYSKFSIKFSFIWKE